MPVLVPFCGRADTVQTVTEAYVVPAGVRFPRFETRPAPARAPAIRTVLYALQAVDAFETSIALRRPRRYEQNRIMRPFAHGGFPTLIVGFAVGDLVRDAVTRRAPEPVRDGANAAQALANVDGILNTQRSMRAP